MFPESNLELIALTSPVITLLDLPLVDRDEHISTWAEEDIFSVSFGMNSDIISVFKHINMHLSFKIDITHS